MTLVLFRLIILFFSLLLFFRSPGFDNAYNVVPVTMKAVNTATVEINVKSSMESSDSDK